MLLDALMKRVYSYDGIRNYKGCQGYALFFRVKLMGCYKFLGGAPRGVTIFVCFLVGNSEVFLDLVGPSLGVFSKSVVDP